MKRIIVLVVAGAIVATACSGTDESSDAATETTSAPPTTAEVTTTTIAATTTVDASVPMSPVVPGADADADAIVDLFAVAFDSETTFEEKAPLIDDPAGLESTVESYKTAGESFGGIFLEVTATSIDSDSAGVMYDLLFGGSPFQSDQIGEAVNNDGQWQVTREYFCSIMELARVDCA